jgi:flagellar basal-body rod protein FlgF
MDKMLYVAMSGAKQNMLSLSVSANNLANTKTTGFKADLAQARAMQAFGEGLPTRVFAMTERASQNFDAGSVVTTGRDLDIAIDGKGWMAVQTEQGDEAYTRDGELKIGETGLLETSKGHVVMGLDGPIALPIPIVKIEIGADGTITVQPEGAPATVQEVVGQIKFVKPDKKDLEKGNDGLFRRQDGFDADADITVAIQSGALEGSNVSPITEMNQMISLQRQFEMQIKLMKTAEENDSSASSLLRSF